MEVLGVVLAAAFLYAAYHVIRVAVRDGMREALEAQRTEADDGERRA